jgi:hypothetical protein
MCICARNRTDSRRSKHYLLPQGLILMPMGSTPGSGVPGQVLTAMTQCAPAVTRIENHDKDPMDPRTVRWPWGGLKGRLCGGTSLGGLLPGVTQPGTWQAVLEASNAEEARKTWRPHHA